MSQNRITGYGVGSPQETLAPVPFDTNKTLGSGDFAYNLGQLAYELPLARWVIYSGNATWIPLAGEGTNVDTLTGDSGGAISPVGGNITITGASTGLTFTGTAGTLSLGGDLIVANGGTGAASFPAHSILIGAGTSAITSLATSATTGALLISGGTGANPVYSTVTAALDADALLSVSASVNPGGPQISLINTNATAGSTARFTIATGATGTNSDTYILLDAGNSSSHSWEFGNQGSTSNSFVIQANPSNTHPYMDGTTVFSITQAGLVTLGAGLATNPASSHTATSSFGSTLTAGTSVQNALGYDIHLNISVAVTAATTATLVLGVGSTSTPTTDTVVASFSAAAATVYSFSAIVPASYYVLVNSTGTITIASITAQACPI